MAAIQTCGGAVNHYTLYIFSRKVLFRRPFPCPDSIFLWKCLRQTTRKKVDVSQEPLNAPFLKKGLFSRGFSRGKTAHEGIRGNDPLRSENGPLRRGNAPLTLMSAAAFWGFSRGGFPENACIGGAVSERNFCEICRRKSSQNTEKHKTKLCAEVPERPLPKDPFFQLLIMGSFRTPRHGGKRLL